MNFLAHCLLSGDDPDILTGNLMADFLKGGDKWPRNPQVQCGIEWHYQIDRFMDSHPLVAQSRGRLFPKYRHYSAVLVDVFYDHLLAIHWEKWSAVPLADFAIWVYGELKSRAEMFPPRMAEVVTRMISDDWLNSYAHSEGMTRALTRMGQRGTRGVDLAASWPDFTSQKSLYEAEFLEFFPQILRRRAEEFALKP